MATRTLSAKSTTTARRSSAEQDEADQSHPDLPSAPGTSVPAPASLGVRHVVVPTDLGDLTVVADGDDVTGVWFPEHRPAPDRSRFGPAVAPGADDVLGAAATALGDYATSGSTSVVLSTRVEGSDRARQVWALIAAIPRGETTTYAALGRAVGVGPRAAGSFVARNPLSVLVPCHRVVGSDGRLTGYAGGLDRKRRLLELEGVELVGADRVQRPDRSVGPEQGSSDGKDT